MKNFICPSVLFIVALVACSMGVSGCRHDKKNVPTTLVNPDFKSAFGYKPGTYWIYKDSATGVIDSAYVQSTSVRTYYPGSCLISNDWPMTEQMDMVVAVSSDDANVKESWTFYMEDSTFYIRLFNNSDKVEDGLAFTLFHYPFSHGEMRHSDGCVGRNTYGYTEVIPVVSVNNESYANAARSAYNQTDTAHHDVYNDLFYVNDGTGIVKVVFYHPQASVHRVLELQRCKIVR